MARILVIEDNAINLELMTYLLHAWGHDTVTATDGDTGLALARSTRPDLVICDIQMPGSDGYAVARAMKADEALRSMPLVAVTAYAMVGDRDRSLEAGFDMHIAKPVDPAQFMQVISGLLPGGHAALVPPTATTAEPSARATIPPELRAPRKGLTVLMVDDLASNLEFKQRLLEPAGYAVIAADGGSEALALLKTHKVDLIVSDVMMADGSGFDLLNAVRADPALSRIAFVFLTGTARDEGSRLRGLALGADAYLLRPIEPERLLAELRAELTRPRR